jgi:hypothetical protein
MRGSEAVCVALRGRYPPPPSERGVRANFFRVFRGFFALPRNIIWIKTKLVIAGLVPATHDHFN